MTTGDTLLCVASVTKPFLPVVVCPLSQSRSCLLLFVVSALIHEAHYKVPPPKSKAFYQRLMAMTALILEQFKNEWMILVLRAQLRP